MVPEHIVEQQECICFHMTDVPYGRGGSPLQNLITRGHKETKLTALRMVNKLDAGPVYLKKTLSLEGSSAEEIFLRAGSLSAKMIEEIIINHPIPKKQEGAVTFFKRRTPQQSALPHANQPVELHNHIRMLDAKGYPKAYLDFSNFHLTFSQSTLYTHQLCAQVTITPLEKS